MPASEWETGKSWPAQDVCSGHRN